MDQLGKCSRRSLLKSGSVLAVAALTAGASSGGRAQQKASKQAMKYQDKPNGQMMCSNCLQFVPPDGCKVVEGDISPNGYCIAWAKKG